MVIKDEKRRHTRVSFNSTVEIVYKDRESIFLEMEDISLSGMQVKKVSGKSPKGECDLILSLSGMPNDVTVRLKGKVVREGKNFAVFEFTGADLDSYLHLRNIIIYNAINPEKVESEFIRHPYLKRV